MKRRARLSRLWTATCLVALASIVDASEVLVVGGEGSNCNEDPQCINRLHPDIPMTARAKPGQRILLRTRNASDFNLDPSAPADPPITSLSHARRDFRGISEGGMEWHDFYCHYRAIPIRLRADPRS